MGKKNTQSRDRDGSNAHRMVEEARTRQHPAEALKQQIKREAGSLRNRPKKK